MRCQASELLGLYTLVKHWVDEHAQDARVDLERKSFYAAVAVVDLIMQAKNSLSSASVRAVVGKLTTAIQQHLRAHKAAYGEGRIKPKHHWLWDVALQLLRDGLVLDAFVVERNHLSIKAFAQHCQNPCA
jgi:hypothetical protein